MNAKEKTVATLSPNTASEVQVPWEVLDGNWEPEAIRQMFLGNSIFKNKDKLDFEKLSRRSSKLSRISIRSGLSKAMTKSRSAARRIKSLSKVSDLLF